VHCPDAFFPIRSLRLNSAFPVIRRGWASKRFWAAIGLVFVLQVGLVFWLSDRSVPEPRKLAAAPVFRVADPEPRGELLALEDPTRFVLAHRHGFSGIAWLSVPRPEFQPEVRTEPLRWLLFTNEEIATEFSRFVQTNPPPPLQTLLSFEPTLRVREISLPSPGPARPTVRFEGDLAKRRWLPGKLNLLPRPNADQLTNSVVQMWVDAVGNTFSAVLLSPRGVAKEGDQYEADQYALQVARSLRFEPIEVTGPGRPKSAPPEMTLGTMIFEWQSFAPTNESPGRGRP
jgi:hypothetical protein